MPPRVPVLFAAGLDGYGAYRISVRVPAPDGSLLAIAEGRKTSSADSGEIDIVSRRSTDGGATWGPLALVTSHGTDTAGNPVVVIDPASGDLVLVSRSEEHTSELQSLMRISYAVFCLKKKNKTLLNL